jgi:hypothetical protein
MRYSVFTVNALAKWMVGLALIAGIQEAGAQSAQQDITYDVNFSVNVFTLTGSITTDGAQTLTASDIVSFNLLDDNPISTSSSSGGVVTCGTACGLTTSDGNLYFNFFSSASALTFSGPNGADEFIGGSTSGGIISSPTVNPGALLFAVSVYPANQQPLGTATAAPEINPASAASAMALLLGGLTVMRGRKYRA